MLGFVQAWAGRHEMNGDGIPYLDIGDAYLRGDLRAAINATWSPLYSSLVSFAMLVFKPNAYWEFALVHLVNFVIYLGALASFTFFLRQLLDYQEQQKTKVAHERWISPPETAWVVLGYSLFIYSSLFWMSPRHVEPDTCVAGFLYLGTALLLRVRMGKAGSWTFVALGSVLALGYLSKTIMFYVGILFLLIALLLPAGGRKLRGVALAAIVFVVLSSPFIVALSRAKGRITIGDAGKIVYSYYIDSAEPFNWHGEHDTGTPVHSTRRVFDSPPVYEFATPIGGTYPNWDDPSYWHEGIKPYLNVKRQLKMIGINISVLWKQISNPFMLGTVAVFLLLFGAAEKSRVALKGLLDCWFLLFPALTIIAIYQLIHLEPRYIAPFIVVACLALFFGIRLPDSQTSRRFLKSVTLTLVVFFAFAVVPPTMRDAYTSFGDLVKRRDAERNYYWQVAHSLNQMGLQPGDKIASLGASVTNSKWARLARVTIVSEIYSSDWPHLVSNSDEETFWASNSSVKEQVMEVFKKTGARAVVTIPPSGADLAGWQRINNTNFYVRFLS